MGLLRKVVTVAVTAAAAKGAATVVSMIDEDSKRRNSGGKSPFGNEYEIIGAEEESGKKKQKTKQDDSSTVSAKARNAFCPYCGAPIKSTDLKCPYCDSELPEEPDEFTVNDLMMKLSAIESQRLVFKNKDKTALEDAVGSFTGRNEREDDERREIIRKFELSKEEKIKSLILTYPIPDSRKGRLDFMSYVISNINLKDGRIDEMDELWMDKMDEVYHKAQGTMMGTDEYLAIDKLYNKKIRDIEHFKAEKKRKEEEEKERTKMILKYAIIIFVILCILSLIFS